jgi:hypothetical protein
MFYEKLAEAKQDKKRGQRNRLDDVGFNVGAGMLAHQGLKRGLDASAFPSPLNSWAKEHGTLTHNPLTKVVDTLSGAEGLRDTYNKHKDHAAHLMGEYNAKRIDFKQYMKEGSEVAEQAKTKLRGRRLLGRRVAHGVGIGGALLGANKLRNMWNKRKQREE